MLYLTSDDYLLESRVISSYRYFKRCLTYHMLIKVEKPFKFVHPKCGPIETDEVILSPRGIWAFKKFTSFPIEVNIYSPDRFNKDGCKYIQAVGFVSTTHQ